MWSHGSIKCTGLITGRFKLLRGYCNQRVLTNVFKKTHLNQDPRNRTLKNGVSWRSGFLLLFVSGTILYNTNEPTQKVLKHIGIAAARISVVACATLRCCYHYKVTISREYNSKEEYDKALSECHDKCATITLHALERNGGVFIKLGQHIGAMTYMLPLEWTNKMIPLQDRCPQSTLAEIDYMFKEDVEMHLADVFESFDPEPIGVASLAQVHTARLKETGEKVAVKCQHPKLNEFVPLDVMLAKNVFKALDVVFPDYSMAWLSDELQNSIYVELDFRNEAKNARLTSEYFSSYLNETALRIPEIVSARKRILIMEFVRGERLDNLKYLDENNISRAEVSACLSHIFNNMIFTPNVGIHCDPHGGNLAIRALDRAANGHNFEIILYDHGLYRTPDTELRRNYAKFWLALLDRDTERMRYYAKKFANINEEQFPILAAAITGRSIDTALNYDISKKRSEEETIKMKKALLEGFLLVRIMSLLSKIPRMVLLILKTNDLTRNLDESLENPLGPKRTFLILAQYCAKTVYAEACENIDHIYRRWSLKWILNEINVWIQYQKRMNQLVLYDMVYWLKCHSM